MNEKQFEALKDYAGKLALIIEKEDFFNYFDELPTKYKFLTLDFLTLGMDNNTALAYAIVTHYLEEEKQKEN